MSTSDPRPAGSDPGAGMTIDELAAHTGVPTRTIRYYQSKGVLPPPVRDGRLGRYDSSHVERLALVGELQERGLQLQAIADLLHQAAATQLSVTEWLGVSETLRSPWADDSPRLFGDSELSAHVGSRPGVLSQVVAAALATREGDAEPAVYVVPSPALLDLVLRLHDAGVDVDVAAAAAKILQRRLSKAAEDLVGLFVENAGDGFGPERGAAGFAHTLDDVRPLAVELARLLFSQQMSRALRRLVDAGKVAKLRSDRP